MEAGGDGLEAQSQSTVLRAVLLIQGVFYITTGIWPFVHLDSFVAVVGPKPDVFQLHVTSALIVVIGIVLLAGAGRQETGTVLLGVLSALTFVALEVAYDLRLRQIYWLDAAAEAAIALLLIIGAMRRGKR